MYKLLTKNKLGYHAHMNTYGGKDQGCRLGQEPIQVFKQKDSGPYEYTQI